MISNYLLNPSLDTLQCQKFKCKCRVCIGKRDPQDPEHSIHDILDQLGQSKHAKFTTRTMTSVKNRAVTRSTQHTTKDKESISHEFDDHDQQSFENAIVRSTTTVHKKYMISKEERAIIEKEVDQKRQLRITKNQVVRPYENSIQSVAYKQMSEAINLHKQKIVQDIDMLESNLREEYNSTQQRDLSNSAFKQLVPQAPIALSDILKPKDKRHYERDYWFMLGNLKEHQQRYKKQTRDSRFRIKASRSPVKNTRISPEQQQIPAPLKYNLNRLFSNDQIRHALKPPASVSSRDASFLKQDLTKQNDIYQIAEYISRGRIISELSPNQ